LGTLLIRILIADDHEAVRRGVRSILLSRPDIEISGEAADGRQAVAQALQLRPDLIILDLTMPVMGGIAAAAELHKLLPDTPVLFYSMHEGDYLVSEAKRLGVRGLVSKGRISETLLTAVDAIVLRHETFFLSAH
jgi:DNA-binding NarL/FixJ family response regulator